MRFVMLIHGAEDEWDAMDEAEAAATMERIMDWVGTWRGAGKLLSGGEELDTVHKAKTIRPGPDGRPVVTDGPYLDVKEVIGGFLILDTDDIDEAVAIAAAWPSLHPSTAIEVRPVLNR